MAKATFDIPTQIPPAAARPLYAGVGVTDLVVETVRDYVADRPKDAFGAHRYSLADTGLDAAEERGRFGSYQRRYDVPDEV